MHYRMEIVLPPTTDVHAAITEVMDPFSENDSDNKYAFWDFWVIGGRWSGSKLLDAIPKDSLRAFRDLLAKRKVTVSAFTAGRESLKPADQIPMVDALWREHFPDSPFKSCPLFSHFGNQYANSENYPDVMTFKEAADLDVQAEVVMICVRGLTDKTKMRAQTLLRGSIWNGVTHQNTQFGGSLVSALEYHKKSLVHYKEPEKYFPADDWLVVTVDYHA